MAKEELAAKLVPGKHASTFGGNCIACAAGIAVVEAIEEDNLIENAVKMGEYAKHKLEQLGEKYDIIKEVRGKGLMIGVQLSSPGAAIVDNCLARGLRINCTNNTVLRFMPAMIVTKEQIDEAINILDSVMGENK
jgi:acetylornithine/succinyldiaminopimelate/putrescine aminotransferase